MALSSKEIRPIVLFAVGGACIGFLAGYFIERSSLMNVFSGGAAMLEDLGHSGASENSLRGYVAPILGLLGAMVGMVVGMLFQRGKSET